MSIVRDAENDLKTIARAVAKRRMELMKNFKIESDEDYQGLGEMFPEDE